MCSECVVKVKKQVVKEYYLWCIKISVCNIFLHVHSTVLEDYKKLTVFICDSETWRDTGERIWVFLLYALVNCFSFVNNMGQGCGLSDTILA
jgi:hypothetical protein